MKKVKESDDVFMTKKDKKTVVFKENTYYFGSIMNGLYIK